MAEYLRLVLSAAVPGAGAAPRGAGLPPQPADLAVGVPTGQVDCWHLEREGGAPADEILVYRPAEPAPPAGYPVICMLDGRAVFESLAQYAHARPAPRALVVGLGYAGPDRYHAGARSYDYTPPSPGDAQPAGSPRDPAARGWALPGGGADRFLERLQERILPFIAGRYPMDPHRQTLWGHSYGGLFALHVALTAPGSFSRYMAASPSLWWNSHYLFDEIARIAAGAADCAADLTILSETPAPAAGRPAAPHSLDAAIERLGAIPGLRLTDVRYPGHSHGQMLTIALAHALGPQR
ncbi:alpha/beta hydrolase [Bordetella sp. 2513F-2]